MSKKYRSVQNVALQPYDFRPTYDSNGYIRLAPPYPSRPNVTTKFFKQLLEEYPRLRKPSLMRWKNIQYEFTPKLLPRPWRPELGRWGGEIIRKELTPVKKTVS